MSKSKYSQYVFDQMKTGEEMMNYNIPFYEGKTTTYIWDEYWHKADFSNVWLEVDIHHAVGARVGQGAEAYQTKTGPCMFGGDAKEGEKIFTLAPHKHIVDEVFMIIGTDPKKPGKLGGEYEFWLGAGDEAEKFVFDTNTTVYCPAGVYHNPHGVTRLDDPDHPIMVFITLLTKGHYGNTSQYPYDDKGDLVYPPGVKPIPK